MARHPDYVTPEERRSAKNAAQRKCNPGWYQRHREEILRKTNIRLQTPKAKFEHLGYIAKKRGWPVEITLDEYLQLTSSGKCFYCEGALAKFGHGIDRVDSSLGYLPMNVRACCKRCNLAKNDMTEAEFRAWIFKIYSKWANPLKIFEPFQ